MHLKPHHKKSGSGFTLMELMVTFLILSVISSLAVVSYRKLIAQQYFRKAYMNVIAIHTRAHALHAKYGDYSLIGAEINAFMDELGADEDDGDFEYSFTAFTADTFEVSAESENFPWGGELELEADQNPISNNNPSCDDECPFKMLP